MNELLLSLNRAGSIPDHLYKQLRSASGATPLLYDLPKIHKPEVPLRPIASFINSPSYQLSKHLVHLLAPPVGKTSSFIKNSTDFAAFISDQTIPEETVLVSFDVVSLFTNVSVDLACQVAGGRLHADESLDDRTTLSPDEVLRLLRFSLDATFVAYQGNWYQQTFGTAMGSPVSVTVANLVMEDVEERALASYPTPPPFWKRFVDDTCTAIPPTIWRVSITTLIPSNPQLSSLMNWKNRENCPSLTYSSNITLMEHCQPQCTERKHIQTSIWISSHTTLWLISLLS